jgi:hypothetical protein
VARLLRRLTKEKHAGSGLARAGTEHHVFSYSLEPALGLAFACTFQSRPAELQLSALEPDKSARKPFTQEVSGRVVGYPSLCLRTHAKLASKASDGSSARESSNYEAVVVLRTKVSVIQEKQYSAKEKQRITNTHQMKLAGK